MRIKIDHQNVYFISDAHFYHANVIKYDGRPFKDVEEMNQRIIINWNSKIGPDDVVFYLGDLSFGDIDRTKNIVSQLNGKIHYILGNHDNERDIRAIKRFESVSDYVHLSILDPDNPRKWQDIMLFHYAILQWDKAHRGAWHLHGHSHGALVKDAKNKAYYDRKVIDIGCNMCDYHPLSYNEIKKIMKNKIVSEHH